MDDKKYAKTWYVYTYADPDTGIIFYVGKGTRARMFAHEMEARCGCSCLKCETIRSIWTIGKTPLKAIVFETFNEKEAYQHESDLIIKYAKTLVNIVGVPEDPKKEVKEQIAPWYDEEIQRESKSEFEARMEAVYAYCQLGPGIFLHYGGLFGLAEHPKGEISGYRRSDLNQFKAWMKENYPRVGAARRELLEREKRSREQHEYRMSLTPEERSMLSCF